MSVPATRVLRVQSVLFEHEIPVVWRFVRSVEAAARLAVEAGSVHQVELAIGDSSPVPVMTEEGVRELEEECECLRQIRYDVFGANLGSSGGQNRLARSTSSDLLLVLNPDTYLVPTGIHELILALDRPGVGAVEARQIPLEHPKFYDPYTGDTSWLSGCCMMVWTAHFKELRGFDDEHFLLHCDDVDFSWRLRAAGWRTVTASRAVVFHDKRPTYGNSWPAPEQERYHAVLGRLMLATRWGHPDIVTETIETVETSGDEAQRRAVAEFRARRAAGSTPAEVANQDVAEFVRGEYALHRF